MPARLTSSPHFQQAISGSPQYLGTIAATTTKNNHDTAAAFNNTTDALKAKVLQLQGDGDFYFLAGTANTAAVTEANGELVLGGQCRRLNLRSSEGWVAVLPSNTASVNVKVWELV